MYTDPPSTLLPIKPGTLENSFMLWVTSVAFLFNAVAAIKRSLAPMELPDFSNNALISA